MSLYHFLWAKKREDEKKNIVVEKSNVAVQDLRLQTKWKQLIFI